MTRIQSHQPTFSRGEIHPSLSGRVDLQFFHSGLSRCRNYIPVAEGIVRRRGGTRYIGEAKSSTVETRLLPFIYSASDGYAIEVTENAFRFWRDNGQVQSGGSPVEVTTTYAAADIATLDYAQSADVLFFAHGSYPIKTLSRTSHTSWTFADYDFSGGPFQKINTDTSLTVNVSGSTDAAVGATVTATASASLFSSDMVGAELYLELEDMDDVAKWLGSTHADPTSTDPAASLYKSSVGQRVRAFGNVYSADDAVLIGPNPPDHSEGSQASGENRTSWTFVHDGKGRGTIASYVSATEVTVTVTKTIPKEIVTNGTSKFRLPEWTSARGYPQAISFYDQRLILAGSATKPQTIWASVLDDYANMEDGTDADQAIVKTMTASNNRVNPILWMVGDEVLIIGTPGQEFLGRSSQLTALIKPDDFVTKEAPSEGSASIKPVRKDGAIFVSRDTQRVIEEAFDPEVGRIESTDLSLTARHLTRVGIEGIAWQQSPEQILWVWLTDGTLASLTYQKKNDVQGWALHDLSGGKVKSACVIPGADGKTEDLYMLVERTIGGSTVRYIEVMQPFYTVTEGNNAADSWYLDSALRYEGSATTTITGLSHLEGQTVTALADGKVVTGLTVSLGSVTLPAAASNVLVGLHSDAYIWTLSPDFGVSDGATAGRMRRIKSVAVKARGVGGAVKVVGSGDDPELLQPSGDGAANTASLIADLVKKLGVSSDLERDHRIEVRQSQPLPLDILALATNTEVSS